MIRELISSDSSTSASISSTAQFFIILSSNVSTKFNFSFGEAVTNSRHRLLIGSIWRRSFALFDNFVITLRFPLHLARVRASFSAILSLESVPHVGCHFINHIEDQNQLQPIDVYFTKNEIIQHWKLYTSIDTRGAKITWYIVTNSYTNFY